MKNNIPHPKQDFDSVKQRLKESLQNQDELKDYDFEGSTLNVLLDTLAYNTVLNTLQQNMANAESNASTAVRRSSVTGKAQDTGYVPTSARSSVAEVFIELSNNDDNNTMGAALIPSGTILGAMSSGVSYIFSTIEDHYALKVPGENIYRAEGVKIYEGRPFTHEFKVVDDGGDGINTVNVDSITNDGIDIPNANADTSTLRVSVLDPLYDSGRFSTYSEWLGNINIKDSSRVYFLSESQTGKSNIKFGNDILGQRPTTGSVIRVEYIVASGPDANGIGMFNQSSEIDGFTFEDVLVTSVSSGGAFSESIDSIKYHMPLSFESQNRGVLSSDYEYLAKQAYPSAKGIISWGGEDNIPPMYGKVFISIIPRDGAILTESDRSTIKKYILDKGSLTTKPVLVDPDYIYVDVNSSVYYDAGRLRAEESELADIIKDSILNYSDVVLGTFKSSLYFSKFASVIDNVDGGIEMNDTSVTISKRVYTNDLKTRQITAYFSNELLQDSISSNTFTYSGFENCFIGAYGNRLAVYTQREGSTIMVASNIGTINYDEGSIAINPIDININDDEYFNTDNQKYFITLSALPKSQSIFSSKSQILKINKVTVKSGRL